MADMMFVGERAEKKIRFAVEPVLNALCSLCLLSQDHLDNISSWVDGTKQHLSDEERVQAELACQAVPFVQQFHGDSFERWLEAFRSRAPEEILRVKAERLRQKALLVMNQESVPEADSLMQDSQTFVGLVEQLHAAHGHESMFDREEEEKMFADLSDGAVYRDKVAAGLAHLWEHYLKEEWPRVRGPVETAVSAFNSVDMPGDTVVEQVMSITERDALPGDWVPVLEKAREVVFVPSVHIGPFMILLDFDGTTAYIAGRARIPQGASVRGVDFDRSELLIRLDALSDETRLRLLELAASRETITTQDAIDLLDLSQSSASRHLTQLTATGLLSVDASERTKRYMLNARRIDDVCDGLKKLLGFQVRT